MLRSIAAFSIVIAVARSSVATDIYVNNVNGDDRYNGGAPTTRTQGSGPLRTIATALKIARKGDRIILAQTTEPYRESITLQGARNSGYETNPFELVGNGAVIDGSVPVPSRAWRHVKGELFRFQPRLTSFQQFFLDDLPVDRLQVSNEQPPQKLKPLQWCLYDRGIYFRTEPGRVPQDYNLTYADQRVGITLYEVRHVVISNLVIQGCQIDGVNAHDGVFNVAITDTICRGNGRSGISVGGASRLRIEDCAIGDNGKAQVRTEGYSKTWLIDCNLIGNTAPKLERNGGQVFIENSTTPAMP